MQLIKTIFQACLFYASHIWMKDTNMQDINRLWYKIIKSSVGAVLNIRRSLAEVILGIPPIMIMNKVSKIKHYSPCEMCHLLLTVRTKVYIVSDD